MNHFSHDWILIAIVINVLLKNFFYELNEYEQKQWLVGFELIKLEGYLNKFPATG